MSENCYGSPAGSCAQCVDGNPNTLNLSTENGVWAFDNNTGIIYWHNGATWVSMGSAAFVCASLGICSVSSLGDVAGAPEMGEVLVWDGLEWVPTPQSSLLISFNCNQLVSCDVEALGNVAGTPSLGQVLTWDGENYVPQDTASAFQCSDLNTCPVESLSDVAGGATEGQALVWRTNTWTPETLAAGGAGELQPLVVDLTNPATWDTRYSDPQSTFVDPDSPTDLELSTAIQEFVAVNAGVPAYLVDNNLIELGYFDGSLFAASWPKCPKRIEVSVADNAGTREVSFENIQPSVPGYTPPPDPIYSTINWPLKSDDWQSVYQSLALPQEAQVCGDWIADGPYAWDVVGRIESFGFVPVAPPTPDLPAVAMAVSYASLPTVSATWSSLRASGDPYATDDTHSFTWMLEDAWRSYNGATGAETSRTVAGPKVELAKVSVINGVATWDWTGSIVTNSTDRAGIEAAVTFTAGGFSANKETIDNFLKGRVRSTATSIEGTTFPQTAGRITEGWAQVGSGTAYLKNAGFGTGTLTWTAADSNTYSEELDRGAEWIFEDVKITEGATGISPEAESPPLETNPTVPTSYKRIKCDNIMMAMWTTMPNPTDTYSAPVARRISASHMNGFDRLLSHGDTTTGAIGGNTWYGKGPQPGSQFNIVDPIQGTVPYAGTAISNTGVAAGAYQTRSDKVNNIGMWSQAHKIVTIPATQAGYIEKGNTNVINTHVKNTWNSIRTDQYFDGTGQANAHLLVKRSHEIRRVADNTLIRELLNVTTDAGTSDGIKAVNFYWYIPNMTFGEVYRYKCFQTVNNGSGDVVLTSLCDLMVAETY